jgi:hypothetical protein
MLHDSTTTRGVTFQNAFFDVVYFIKKIDVSDCIRILVTTFSAFQKKVKICLYTDTANFCYHVVRRYMRETFFPFLLKKADEVVKRNQKRHYFTFILYY